MQVVERQRAKRIDAGTVRQTARDAELLEWMSHMCGLPLDLLQRGLGVSQVRAYQLVQRWKKAGWVRTAKADVGSTWIYPTRHTTSQYLGWDAEWIPRATTTAHVRAAAAVRIQQTGFDLQRWTSERTLRHEEGGYRRKGKTERHTPDGVEILPDGKRVLIEVELTAKSPERYVPPQESAHLSDVYSGLLLEISNRARDLGCFAVAYWCAPTAAPVVSRAVEEFRRRKPSANDVEWFIRSLEEVPGWTPQAYSDER